MGQSWGMKRAQDLPPKQDFLPNDAYMLISFDELETAWRMMTAPDKLKHLDATISAVRRLNQLYGPQKALYHMISATAWLTADDRVGELGIDSDNG